MNLHFSILKWTVVLFLAVALVILPQTSRGDEYSNDEPVTAAPEWPAGMKDLVNAYARVHGYWVNAVDVFFFTGGTEEFSGFLKAYSEIDGISSHRLTLHPGKGQVKSPWDEGRKIPCDWKLVGYPETWKYKDADPESYILEVHLWLIGNVDFSGVDVPANVQVTESKKNDRFIEY